MSFKFLSDNNMERLIPSQSKGVINPVVTITYSEDDIRRICKEHLNERFDLNVDESDFYINLSFDTDTDGYETKDFYCELDESILSDESLEMLEEKGYLSCDDYFDSLLRVIMAEEFKNPEYIDIDAFLGPDNTVIVGVMMSLEHCQ